MTEDERHVWLLQGAWRQFEDSKMVLEREIREAHAAGMSPRKIAKLIGWSHETVRKLVTG